LKAFNAPAKPRGHTGKKVELTEEVKIPLLDNLSDETASSESTIQHDQAKPNYKIADFRVQDITDHRNTSLTTYFHGYTEQDKELTDTLGGMR